MSIINRNSSKLIKYVLIIIRRRRIPLQDIAVAFLFPPIYIYGYLEIILRKRFKFDLKKKLRVPLFSLIKSLAYNNNMASARLASPYKQAKEK